jgi:hypothetical protein
MFGLQIMQSVISLAFEDGATIGQQTTITMADDDKVQ